MSLQFLREHYLDQPFEVSLETLALCNAKCEFCTYPNLERIGTELNEDLMLNIFSQLCEFDKPFYLSPFKVNEPLLDKRLFDWLIALECNIDKVHFRLFTNGSPLTEKNIEQINALTRVEHLWISLNSCDPQEYERIMKLPFERTASKLDLLHKITAGGGMRHKVVLSKVSEGREKDTRFVRYVYDRWPIFEPVLIKRDGWLGDIDAPALAIPATPCSRWFELSIMATGIVSLCCMDGHGKFSIGDLNTQTLLEVYNAPAWRERRERMLSRHEVFPCSTCSY
jgi:hypothetical protein